jgi:nucleoside-diphosphate-sugar epimerase
VRVVVTGASGNVGTATIERLVADDRVTEVVGLARRRPSWQPEKTRWEEADVVTDDLVPVFRGADAVVHLAWLFQPTHDPLVTWVGNVGGATRVFDAVATAGVPALVYASSVGAYAPGPRRGTGRRVVADPRVAHRRLRAGEVLRRAAARRVRAGPP